MNTLKDFGSAECYQ